MLRDQTVELVGISSAVIVGGVEARRPLAFITPDQAMNLRLDLLDCEYPPVPAFGKDPAVKGWPRFTYRAPSEGALKEWQTLADGMATNTGIACGRIRVIDLDIDDHALCLKAQKIIKDELGADLPCRVGRWPRVALFARQLGLPRQTIRRDYQLGKVEYLGDNGHVIVHGIHPDTGKAYYWVGDPLWEIPKNSLPTITREQENRIGPKLAALLGGLKKGGIVQGTSTVVGLSGLIPDGHRNFYLKEKLHLAVAKAKSQEELQEEAELINNTCFEEPLPEAEIKKQVKYWWQIKESGRLLIKGGEPAAFLRKSEHQQINNPNAISLLILLRIYHGYARGTQFFIVPESMTELMNLGPKPIRNARNLLLKLGLIRKVGGLGRKHSPYKYILT